MERRVLWMALLLGAALSFGCGGDDSGDDGDDDSASEEGNAGDNGGTSGNGAGGGMVEGEGEPCGTVRCSMPEGATAQPCCFDAFTSTCGMIGGFGGMSCVSQVENDERCPTVQTGPIQLASCCTEDNMCGITAPMFGNGECTELSVAEQRAIDRAMMFMNDEDGGIDFPDGGGMFTIDFPDPQPCE